MIDHPLLFCVHLAGLGAQRGKAFPKSAYWKIDHALIAIALDLGIPASNRNLGLGISGDLFAGNYPGCISQGRQDVFSLPVIFLDDLTNHHSAYK